MAGRRQQTTTPPQTDATAATGGPDFVHLHVHSEYSLLDGLARIPAMVSRARELAMPALAITDHGAMYGVIDFYAEAKKAGIKPIIGCEIYVAPRSMGQRESKVDDKNYHLTLLARDETGYHNLLKIVSRAHLDGFYYKPRADKELLARHKDGLICLSGCMSGEVSRLLLEGQPAQARAAARWYADLFGKDSYYVEIQNQLLRDQVQLNQDLVALARELDLPLVATNDSHYVRPEDSRAHDVLLCIQTNAQVEQQNRMRLETNEFYLRSGAEMARALPDLPDALRNTIAIAEQVNLKLDFDRVQLPHFDLPEGHTPLSYLKERVYEGLKWRYGTPTPEHYARADYELGVIERTGYPLYFLIVADYVRYARERGILAVPRGSVAGSLCIYALGICDVDPLRYRLMFERFLNEERIGMPDIDMDFADDRREEVIRYVQQKYGRDRVAQIITFGTMAAKAAVRDVGRVLGMSYGEVDKVAKAIPFGNTIAEARESYELKQLLQESPKVEELLGLAEAVEGLARNASTHAAGVVIARDPLDEHVPLQKATKGEEGVITQWPMTVIEKVGMLKMDFLGLANLTILDHARRIIEERRPGFKLDLQHLPMDYDEPTGTARQTYDMLGEGHTTAVFQLESPPMRRCLKGLRPNRISDLLAIVALYRPGPMENIPAFTAAKNGQQAVTYLHPDLQPILEETYGVCVAGDTLVTDARSGRRLRIDSLGGETDLLVQGVDGGVGGTWEPAVGRVTHWVHTGRKPIFRVTLRNGASIKTTADHKFLTERGWIPCDALAVGSRVGTPFRLEVTGQQKATPADVGRAVILGYLLADGGLSTSAPGFYSKDPCLAEDFIQRCRAAFGPLTLSLYEGKRGVRHVYFTKPKKSPGTFHRPSALDEWLVDLGLRWKQGHPRALGTRRKGVTSAEKFVPEWVFTQDDSTIAQFLAALWDCDGYVGPKLCHYKTISPTLAADVQTLLLRLGLRSTIYRSTYAASARAGGGTTTAYQVTVYDTRRFAALIQRLMLTAKSAVRCVSVAHNMLNRGVVMDEIRETVPTSKRALQRTTGFSRLQFRGRSTRIADASITSLLDHFDLPLTRRLARVCWEEVVAIDAAGEEDVYDITVEGLHSFVGNNIIVHNCVYQDQVLQIVRAIAGFSWGEADVLRKAMGKKIAALMDEQREKFLKRTAERGYTEDFAQQLWAIIAPFAGYGFPKGHAAAYAVIAYQTAYLKANYPAEYMAAVLTAEAGNAVKVAEAVAECHRLGVAVRPPDVNRSGLGFTLEDDAGANAIRFGLSGVKNVGDGAIEMLLKARQAGGAFVDLADFCRRVDLRQLNKRAVESLIKAGAMAAFGDAAALLAGLDGAMALAQQHQRARQVGQTTLFDLLGGGEGDAALPVEPAFALPVVPAVERRQRLAWEKEMIGLYISEHPLRAVARALAARNTCPIAEITEEMAGQTVTLGGFIASLRLIPTKKGDLMAAVELEDMGGSAEVIVFPRTYQAQRELLKEDTIVLVTGKIEARDDRPKILCETVELFEAAEDEMDEPLPDLAPSGAQTAFPLDAGEAAAAELEGPAPGVLETVPSPDLVLAAADAALATSVDMPATEWPLPELPDMPTIAAAAVVVEEVVSVDVPFDEMPAAVAAGASTRHFVLDLMIERSAREDRDVNRLVRLNELLGRFPGHDKVVLRFLVNGRAGPALELNERVECCEPLLEELLKELGDQGVRVRVAGADMVEASEIPQEGRDEVVAALAGAVPGGGGSGATRSHWS